MRATFAFSPGYDSLPLVKQSNCLFTSNEQHHVCVYGVLQILASLIICVPCTKYVFCNSALRGQCARTCRTC